MSHRLVHHYAIKARRGGPDNLVAPDDFDLTLRATSAAPYLPRGALGYCADLVRERVLFTCHAPEDFAGMFAGPFLFVEQLRTAGSVISVPFERLGELGLVAGTAAPVFVFSPGRAGTTLLASVLCAAGVACASEPDMLTQAVWLTDPERQALPPGADATMATMCVESLGRVLGRGAFLKLRSQCNARPLALVEASPGCRVIFVVRGAQGWALSRNRAFAEPPNHVAMLLREAMDAFDLLAHADVKLDVVWFEALVRDPLGVVRACAPAARPDPARIAAVMARDSQGGTILARDVVGGTAVARDFLSAFEAAWHGARATAAWGGRTRELLDRMWEEKEAVLF